MTINLGFGGQSSVRGLGGQNGVKAWGSGGMVADAARADVSAVRDDARIEGAAADAKAAPSAHPDGRQAVDQAPMPVDTSQAMDQAATPDRPAKETGVRDVFDLSDVRSPLDVGATDKPSPAIDASGGDTPAVYDAAAAECRYGGVAYSVGESFPSDCNTCFCVAGGEVVCTVKPCSIDGGAR